MPQSHFIRPGKNLAMLFNIFNMEKHSDTAVLLYGKFPSEGDTPIHTVQVRNIVSPVYFLPSDGSRDRLLADLYSFTDQIVSVEEVTRQNIFFRTLPTGLSLLRVHLAKKISFEGFGSVHCELVLSEFSSPVENLLVGRGLKGPCQVEIRTGEEEGVTVDCNNRIIGGRELPTVVEYGDIAYVGNVVLSGLRVASIATDCRNNGIQGFAYHSASKCVEGAVSDGSGGRAARVKGGPLWYDNPMRLTAALNELIGEESPDVVVFHNFHLRNRLKISDKIICDIFQFASANLKGKDHSIKEIAELYDIELGEDGLAGSARAIFQIFEKTRALSLAKELAEISGYILNKCLDNSRSDRVEYTLLHELYSRGFLFPPHVRQPESSYTGGLVLEPRQGFYEDFVLLLDFNSLYPSIIQEFNVCFSTVGWCDCPAECLCSESIFDQGLTPILGDIRNESGEKANLLCRSDETDRLGKRARVEGREQLIFLPKILKNLIHRRKMVKELLKNATDPNERILLDTRQSAIKLTANSIYGCLGSPLSRFCNYKMASFITAKGRELLSSTKAMADEMGMQVIYGDTDSIMIHTKYKGSNACYKQAVASAMDLVKKINSKYQHVEIEFEKAFKKLLLYTKKKYAALVYSRTGSFTEYKGLDLLRRDFCKASRDLCKAVIDIILADDEQQKAAVTAAAQPSTPSSTEQVYAVCYRCADSLPRLPTSEFAIFTSLNKDLSAYNKQLNLPHVNLALRLKKEKGLLFRHSDVIAYCIGKGTGHISQRTFHPDEKFDVDIDWYIQHQMLPPLTRITSLWPHVHSEKIDDIFGVKRALSSRPVSKNTTFITDCCGSVQEPSLVCHNCHSNIPASFYIRKVSSLLAERCSSLHSAYAECLECSTVYYNHLQTCVQCSKPLQFHFENRQFDEFLIALKASFDSLNISEVDELIQAYSGASSYRTIDLSRYFQRELAEADLLLSREGSTM